MSSLVLFICDGVDHLAEDHGNVGEALVSVADVVQAAHVKQDLLQDEGCHRFGQLTASFHYPQAQRDYLSGEEKGDDILLICFDQGSDDTEAGQAQVLKGAALAGGVEKRIEEQRYVGT